MTVVGELWRYPVKSMGGHRVPSALLTARGVHADRLWAVRDLGLATTTTARRLPVLLQCSARYAAEPSASAGPGEAGEVIVTFPDGEELSSGDVQVHARLSDLVGRAVELRPLPPLAERSEYRGARLGPGDLRDDLRSQLGLEPGEPFPDFSMMSSGRLAQLTRYATPVGAYVDVYPLHLLTEGSLEAMRRLAPQADFDVRRFRPNVVLSGSGEFDWCGGSLRGSEVCIDLAAPTVRCSMPVREQPGLPAQPEVMRTIRDHSHRCLGVYAEVAAPGTLSEGDELRLDPPRRRPASRVLADRIKRRVVAAATRAALRG